MEEFVGQFAFLRVGMFLSKTYFRMARLRTISPHAVQAPEQQQ